MSCPGGINEHSSSTPTAKRGTWANRPGCCSYCCREFASLSRYSDVGRDFRMDGGGATDAVDNVFFGVSHRRTRRSTVRLMRNGAAVVANSAMLGRDECCAAPCKTGRPFTWETESSSGKRSLCREQTDDCCRRIHGARPSMRLRPSPKQLLLIALILVVHAWSLECHAKPSSISASGGLICSWAGLQDAARARMAKRPKRGAPSGYGLGPLSSMSGSLHYHLSHPNSPLGQFLDGLSGPFSDRNAPHRRRGSRPYADAIDGHHSSDKADSENSIVTSSFADVGKNRMPPSSPSINNRFHVPDGPIAGTVRPLIPSTGQDTAKVFRNILEGLIDKFGQQAPPPLPSPSSSLSSSVDEGSRPASGEVGPSLNPINPGTLLLDGASGLTSGYELWSFDACTAEYSSLFLPSSDKSASDNIFRYIKEIANLTARTSVTLYRHAVKECGFKNQTYDSWAATEAYERCLPRPTVVAVKFGNKLRETLKEAFVKVQVYALAQKVTYDYFNSLRPGPNATLKGNLKDITCNMQHLRDSIRDELLINHAFSVPIRTNMPITTTQVVDRCSVKGDPCVKALRMFHTAKSYMDSLKSFWIAEGFSTSREGV